MRLNASADQKEEMTIMSRFRIFIASALVVACMATGAFASGELNAYTIMPEKYASQVFEVFTAETGIKVNFMRFSSGEALARVVAEKNNPQVDMILGGPADTYEAGIKEGVTGSRRNSALPKTTGPASGSFRWSFSPTRNF